ncbi:hypothetical protein DFR31_1460 [Alkalispirillum mobile]|uniref:Monooxygenase ydhR n=1 Tax=Alkalispirillum mobile TaxID=85925 RepID=A0A498C8N0_9GAMM|nr:hypothetical protein DFR31_1460 [Alkalispirillum mobile]
MIAAIVKYRLPPTISREDCRAHFYKISEDFCGVQGLLSKHFVCDKDGVVAGGIYFWESAEAATKFYKGPWRDGIFDRYGMYPDIEYLDVFARTDNVSGQIDHL